MWTQKPLDDRRARWFRETLRADAVGALLELPARRVLVTHGAPVLDDGAAALRAAVAAEPWYHHG